MAAGEKQEPFWRRHLVAVIVGGFAALLVVIIAGQLLDQRARARASHRRDRRAEQ